MRLQDYEKAKLIQERLGDIDTAFNELQKLYKRHKAKTLTSEDIEKIFNYATSGMEMRKDQLRKEFDAL